MRRTPVRSLLLAGALALTACTGNSTSVAPTGAETSTTAVDGPATTVALPEGLDLDPLTHTVDRLRTIADYDALAKAGIGDQAVLKFSVTEFSSDPELVWLDSGFFTLHDEWYWFNLLNGRAVRGFDTAPVDALDGRPDDGFATVADTYEWAQENRSALPLDLRFTSLDRLYSPTFYDVALDAATGRRIGVGALIRTPDPASGDDRWVIELEFSDDATIDQIETYFDVVAGSVPSEIGDRLEWVPRSRDQELTANRIEAEGGPFADRIVRYAELAVPGEVEVYSPAIAAGRLLVVTDGGRWSLSDAGPNDIVAIDRAPDDLPLGNGLLTGTPQTPLAHVNILALNRGIPNAYVAGLADDPTIAQLGRVRAPVMVRTAGAGELEIVPLTDAEYQGWLATQGRAPIAVPAVDVATIPYTETLDSIGTRATTASDLDALRPVIGGKAAGFVELAVPGTTTMPPTPLSISIRPYVEHMDRYTATIDALLADDDLDSARGRYLFLEGREDYDARYTSVADVEFADEFTATHPAGTPIGDALAADGFVKLIRSGSIDPATLEIITADVRASFADLAPEQGLRFRSSSTVEDIEGFNGAGLYDSNTGFLDNEERSIERAILRTWSSYWNAVAFEERQRENVDHRSGAMAVLVHPRFDDELELSNGVATYTVGPDADTAAVMRINVQDRDVSVTNPNDDEGLRPEVIDVVLTTGASEPEIIRIATSTLSAEVLSDEQVFALFDETAAVAESWLTRANAELPAAQRSSTLTLDLEFREMADGWPALADGSTLPSRMILKQARTLDPGLRAVPDELLTLPVPRDVLAHTASAVALVCLAGDVQIVGVRLERDPFAPVDPGFGGTSIERWALGTQLTAIAAADVIVGDLTSLGGVYAEVDTNSCEERDVLVLPSRYLLDLLAAR